MIECRTVEAVQRFIAATTAHVWLAFTLARDNIAVVVYRAAQRAVARFATVRIVLAQAEMLRLCLLMRIKTKTNA